MKTEKLTLYKIIFSIVLASTAIYAVLTNNSMLLIISIITGFALTILLASKKEKPIVDERSQLINEKASTTTPRSFTLGASTLGFLLLGLDYINYAELSSISLNLLYFSCSLMILNTIFGIYYRRKYGASSP